MSDATNEVITKPTAKTEPDAAIEPKKMSVEMVDPVPSSKKVRPRNYSHLERNPETLDTVEACDGKTYTVPATMGSMYWAILVAMYEQVNKPVSYDDLVERVDQIMREYDEESWDEYCNKENTTVWKRGKGQREVQQIKSSAERTINNAKTLCRWKDYGKRLYERGHVLRHEYDDKAQPHFVLRTSLDCLKPKPKKDKKDTIKAEPAKAE